VKERKRSDWETKKSIEHRGYTILRTFFRVSGSTNNHPCADNRKRLQGYECFNWQTGEIIEIVGDYKTAFKKLNEILDVREKGK
jgi:hypothetical protein